MVVSVTPVVPGDALGPGGERGVGLVGAAGTVGLQVRDDVGHEVVPAGELEGQVKEWASRLAAGPTTALSLTKAMLNDAYALSFEQAIEEESRSQTINSAAQGSRAAIEGALKKDS